MVRNATPDASAPAASATRFAIADSSPSMAQSVCCTTHTRFTSSRLTARMSERSESSVTRAPALRHELNRLERENRAALSTGAVVNPRGGGLPAPGLAQVRSNAPGLNQAMNLRHTMRLKEIIDQYGWPTRRMVGPQAVHSAFE